MSARVHQTEKDAEAIWADHLIWPQDYDKPMRERYWEDRWELGDGLPKRTAGSGVSSGLRLELPAGRVWNFMRALTPEITACGSMQWTNCRCLCCRRVSWTSRCRSRSWKGPSDASSADDAIRSLGRLDSEQFRLAPRAAGQAVVN